MSFRDIQLIKSLIEKEIVSLSKLDSKDVVLNLHIKRTLNHLKSLDFYFESNEIYSPSINNFSVEDKKNKIGFSALELLFLDEDNNINIDYEKLEKIKSDRFNLENNRIEQLSFKI